ncbi:unnamed protein product [Microthlaspi erraticum]|uniref:Uncharacterized protein n=1 Tax=Microthlaspi erraticum TaxID=1685480 RepID=A0A6D2L458_9BRAS|nr:unnamed protein product [Microthlaspi erraticum]
MASPRSLSGLPDDPRRLVLSSSSMAIPFPFLSCESIPITRKIRKFEDWSNQTRRSRTLRSEDEIEHNLTRSEQFVFPSPKSRRIDSRNQSRRFEVGLAEVTFDSSGRLSEKKKRSKNE